MGPGRQRGGRRRRRKRQLGVPSRPAAALGGGGPFGPGLRRGDDDARVLRPQAPLCGHRLARRCAQRERHGVRNAGDESGGGGNPLRHLQEQAWAAHRQPLRSSGGLAGPRNQFLAERQAARTRRPRLARQRTERELSREGANHAARPRRPRSRRNHQAGQRGDHRLPAGSGQRGADPAAAPPRRTGQALRGQGNRGAAKAERHEGVGRPVGHPRQRNPLVEAAGGRPAACRVSAATDATAVRSDAGAEAGENGPGLQAKPRRRRDRRITKWTPMP